MNIVIVGANSEIAKNVGRLYCKKDNSFLLVSRNQEKLKSIQADYLARGASEVKILPSEIQHFEQIETIFQKVTDELRTVDLLIIAHGILPDQIEVEERPSMIDGICHTNMISYMELLLLFGHFFERQKNGVIAVFSSVAGDRGRRSNYVYGSMKSGIQTFLEGFAAKMSRSNVHVIDIRPGMVSTPMTSHLKKGILFTDSDKVAKDIFKAISRRKMVLYTPSFWKLIMLVIKAIPRTLLYRLNF